MIPSDIRCIGDGVRTGRYKAVSRFRRAIHYRNGSHHLTAVEETVDAGPDRLVFSRPAWRAWPDPAPPIYVSAATVQVGERRYSRKDIPIYHSALPALGPPTSPRTCACLRALETLLRNEAPAASIAHVLNSRQKPRKGFEQALFEHASQQIARLAASLRNRKQAHALRSAKRAARQLAGLGHGLTPSGDDFLAGVLLALHAFGRAPQNKLWIRSLRRAAQTDHELSAYFLAWAARGCAPASLQQLTRALACGHAVHTRFWGRRVMRWGATSGADLLSGFVIAAQALSGISIRRNAT